jgi:radical SAM superfamily enzyme YgiQ (UPF0313 family)
MRVTFVTSGLEHLGIAALSAYVKAHGHESALVYEPKPFSSNSGPDSALFARWLEPTPQETARRIVATNPDVMFGGPHVSGAPAHSIREASIDAVVEGEGEGALLDLLECAQEDRFGRRDVPNVWFKGEDGPIANGVRCRASSASST